MTNSRLLRHKPLALLAAVVLAAGGAAVAVAGAAAGQDTSAVAVNTKDDSSVFRFAFKVIKVKSDTVDNTNAAVAYASCTLCQTVAISVQVLLVASDPSDFSPTNIAIAYNENCTLCDTLASAYQFAVGVATGVKLSPEGRREIAALRIQLEALRRSGLSGPEIQQQLSGYMQQLSTVLATELVAKEPKGPDGNTTQPPPDTATEPAPATTETPPTTTDTTPAPTDTQPTTTETTPTTTTETTPTTTDTTPTQTETTPTTTTG